MYSPPLGRFLSRDPLPQNGESQILYDNNWFGDALTLMRNLYGYVDNSPVNFTDSSGLGKDSVTAAIENCLKRPTLAGQLQCLKDLSGSGYKQGAIDTAKCLAAYSSYKAADATAGGCYSTSGCSALTAKAAAAAAVVVGRTAYLQMKCDYILAGSIAKGSAKAEAGHKTALAQATTYAAKCAALAVAACKVDPLSCTQKGDSSVPA